MRETAPHGRAETRSCSGACRGGVESRSQRCQALCLGSSTKGANILARQGGHARGDLSRFSPRFDRIFPGGALDPNFSWADAEFSEFRSTHLHSQF